MPAKIDFERKSKPASDRAVEDMADEIVALLKEFDSPKDAGAAFALAHIQMIEQSFPPENRTEAIQAVDAHARLVKDCLSEWWQ